MTIRKAKNVDVSKIMNLLLQVGMVHHNGRPDIFKANSRKYTVDEVLEIMADENTPIFVCADENDAVLGYAFCEISRPSGENIMCPIKTLYIDDLCVDENIRGSGIGKALYEYVLDFAKEIGCYNVTLNVWSCNESAMKFYERMGLSPQKVGMEKIL